MFAFGTGRRGAVPYRDILQGGAGKYVRIKFSAPSDEGAPDAVGWGRDAKEKLTISQYGTRESMDTIRKSRIIQFQNSQRKKIPTLMRRDRIF